MLKHPDISYDHVTQFTALFKQQKLQAMDMAPVTMSVTSPAGTVSYDQAMQGDFRPVSEGELFTGMWSHHWFKIEGRVPDDWTGSEVGLIFENDAEALIWSDGVVLQSIINCSWPGQTDNIKPYCPLVTSAKGGQTLSCVAQMSCCAYWGYLREPFVGSREQREFVVKRVRLVRFDREAWDLWLRLDSLLNLYRSLPAGPNRTSAITAAYEMTRLCDLDDRSSWTAAIQAGDGFFNVKQPGNPFKISAIGEAHIDTAWMWPVEETKRKCAGGFAGVMRLMEKYPDLVYSCSQALQFRWMRDLYPDVWKQIQRRVSEGRFVPVGGSWIEPDCNVPSGESLARQFLFGQRFFRQEFGITCEEFWQPDVFGYTAALPQILKLSGISNFYTIKLWGNQFNKPVNTSFLWEGIDGTQTFTHLPPGGFCFEADTVLNQVNHYLDHDRGHETLMTFGYGDAGGAPTEVMLDRYRLLKDIPAMPDIEIRSAPEFFKRAKADIKDPATWVGELYFEEHRGTFTSQAAVKRDNRRSEEMLHDLELLASLASALKLGVYPQSEINALWETVLLNQFHDILPGSSIPDVYEVTRKEYAQIAIAGHQMKSRLIAAMASETVAANLMVDQCEEHPFGVPSIPKISSDQPNLLVVNTLSFDRSEVVDTSDGPACVTAPSMGYAVVTPQPQMDDQVTVTMSESGYVLENGLVRAAIDATGRITSFFDKRNRRETVKSGCVANQMALFEDHPRAYDAWNLDIYHLDYRREVGEAISASVVDQGGLRGNIRVETAISAVSSMSQTISLDARSCRLNFDVVTDWHEDSQMLKVEFPLDIHTDYATYEIQFGHLRRPTHYNTSWDWARFEVPGQRWADLSEPAFGVALINDSKYGYSCHAGVLSLSLLRSPKWPDPQADMGRHWFRYALYPHAGGPQLGGVVREAMCFNQPLAVLPTVTQPTSKSFFEIDNPAIVIDTVKKAEDSDDLIVRLYESSGSRQTGCLTTALPVVSAEMVNILEDQLDQASWDGGLTMTLRAFEIVSYRLRMG